MFCHKCGSEILDEAVICVHCGCMVKKSPPSKDPSEDKIEPFWMALSIMIPLAGIIYGAVNYREVPNASKTYILAGSLILILFAAIILDTY